MSASSSLMVSPVDSQYRSAASADSSSLLWAVVARSAARTAGTLATVKGRALVTTSASALNIRCNIVVSLGVARYSGMCVGRDAAPTIYYTTVKVFL